MTPQHEVMQITVADAVVGIIGLRAVLEEASRQKLAPDQDTAHWLLEGIRGTNYIAPGYEAEYERALLRAYRKHRGEAVEERRRKGLRIQVLGPGCPACERLTQMVQGGIMKFKDYSVTQILVGLHRIGVVGLHEALRKAEEEGLAGQEAIVDRVMEHLGRRNYIPDSLVQAYRIAVWREFLRRRGADINEFYSEVAVTVRGEPGEERDRFVEMVRSVLAEFELRPVVTFEPASEDGPSPQLGIGEDTIVRGMPSRQRLKLAVRQSISDW